LAGWPLQPQLSLAGGVVRGTGSCRWGGGPFNAPPAWPRLGCRQSTSGLSDRPLVTHQSSSPHSDSRQFSSPWPARQPRIPSVNPAAVRAAESESRGLRFLLLAGTPRVFRLSAVHSAVAFSYCEQPWCHGPRPSSGAVRVAGRRRTERGQTDGRASLAVDRLVRPYRLPMQNPSV
jgi:hypothetical protein